MAENTPQRTDPREALKKIPIDPVGQLADKIKKKIEEGADPDEVRRQMANKTNKVMGIAATAAAEGIQDEWTNG
jgi:hypothetical protein